ASVVGSPGTATGSEVDSTVRTSQPEKNDSVAAAMSAAAVSGAGCRVVFVHMLCIFSITEDRLLALILRL
ncbi:MAG: hypothetical protein ACPGES_05990, partial [Coraliomargarita sp.]